MVFHSSIASKYKIQDFLLLLEPRPLTIPEIQKDLKCSYRTAHDTVRMLVEMGLVSRINRTSEARPIYEYYLNKVYEKISIDQVTDKVKIESTKIHIKPKLSDMGMEL